MYEKYKKLSITVKASFWFVICSFLQKGISLLTTPIFTRVLTTEEYGRYTLYNSWLGIFSIIVTLKLSEAVFNKVMISAEDFERRKTLASVQWLAFLLWLAYTVIFVFFHNAIAELIKLPQNLIGMMLVEILFETAIALWSAYQRFEYKYKALVCMTLLISILNPVLGLIAVNFCDDKAFARILGILISQILIGVILFIYNIRYTEKKYVKNLWPYLLTFNLPLIPHYLSQVLLSQADRIMIGRLIGESEAALYGVAYTIGMLATMVTQSVNNAYVPWMYRALKQKKYKEIADNNFLLLVIVSAVIMGVYLVAPEIIMVIGGKQYLGAVKVVYPVACSVLYMFIYGLFANIEYYYNTRRYVVAGSCISAVLNIILNYIFLNMYGYVAAAFTTLFCYVCYSILHIFVSNRVMKKYDGETAGFRVNGIAIIAIGMTFFSVILQMLINYPGIRYLILVGILGIVVAFRKRMIEMIQKFKGDS